MLFARYWTIGEKNVIKRIVFNELKRRYASSIILDSEHTLIFNEFNSNNKHAIINKVIELSNGTRLHGLEKCNSYEGGFSLPLTSMWKDAIKDQNETGYKYIQYHRVRNFRFQGDSTINRLYTKDMMRWWTSEEKQEFKKLIEKANSLIN
tara:strand:- start:536 stop:985 length:450 start_codon:yes stop_codon:yes gene_type:complete